MKQTKADIVIVGAGPVGLMCGYLAYLSGMNVILLDKSDGPLKVGRADALNARTLQLLEVAGLFDELYPLGKTCNTSSVWANGQFLSRQSKWWDALDGCFHKHFLMLGQSHFEKLLDQKLRDEGVEIRRQTTVWDVATTEEGCTTFLTSGDAIQSDFVIGADGSRSLVREILDIPFPIIRPEIVWAVIDGVISTDFPKVPEIIVFQAETSDVAWIPREGEIDRFYVRMDRKEFTFEEAMAKVNRAMSPHSVRFEKVEWFSQFSVKEAVAERYSHEGRVFLAGDACHVHSVNGGQGLNTGLADAFNLVWKLNMVRNNEAPEGLLLSYEAERKTVARGVVEASGELVRSTKFSATGTHAQDYVQVVEKRAGYVTGMGIRYGGQGPKGQRLPDFEVSLDGARSRVYSLLSYAKYTLLLIGDLDVDLSVPDYVQVMRIPGDESLPYENVAILVRPDSYIDGFVPLEDVASLLQVELAHGTV